MVEYEPPSALYNPVEAAATVKPDPTIDAVGPPPPLPPLVQTSLH